MTAGSHTLSVIAKKAGYEDSDPSNVLSFTAYAVTGSATKGSITLYDSFIFSDEEAFTGTVVPSSGCVLPTSISVTNATLVNYSSSTGIFSIENPTGAVTITAVCLQTYSITPTLVNATAAPGNATVIHDNETVTLTYAFDGTNYVCPATGPTVTGATGSWTKVSDTQGTLQLSNPTGAVSFTISGEEALPQLDTPTNLSVADTTASFDEVENAESYEFYVDDVSIGTYTVYDASQAGTELTIENAPASQSGNEVTIG